MAVCLGDVCTGRDNNFNLIRMLAATAVLVSHAYPIALGTGTTQPLEPLIGKSLGWVAVGVFFTISGFLITRSLDRKARIASWLAARILRLFPALIIVVFLVALVLGPLTTTLTVEDYFSDPRVATYIVRNITLASLQYDLPAVFEELPYPQTINGSLWTLIHEVLCYFSVLILGFLGLIACPRRMAAVVAIYIILYFVIGGTLSELIHPKLIHLRNLSLPFAVGMVLYIWRDRVPLGWRLSAVLGAAAIILHDTPVFAEVFVVWMSYTTFVFAYLPGGIVRYYNALGDYSYGFYIYAFPAQQLVMHLFGPMTPWQNMALAFPITLFCAVLSWQWIEKPALAARQRVTDLL